MEGGKVKGRLQREKEREDHHASSSTPRMDVEKGSFALGSTRWRETGEGVGTADPQLTSLQAVTGRRKRRRSQELRIEVGKEKEREHRSHRGR